jgi:outer membrane lipoprotein-sorting protein
MRNALKTLTRVLLVGALVLTLASPAGARKGKHPTGLAEILMHMNEASKNLKTISAHLVYTTVTVLVDDHSDQSGQFYYRKGKIPDILIDFEKPERKILLLKKNLGQIFIPKINQVQEFNLAQKSDVVQQFLLLGFGSDTNELKKIYDIKYLEEEELGPDSTVKLELTPRKPGAAAQITKIQIWVAEDSWLPEQQQFFESSGDYLVARYSDVQRDRPLRNSIFQLNIPPDAKHIKMN